MRIIAFVYHQILLKILYPLILCLCVFIWCFTTQSGLETLVQFSKVFIPGTLKIEAMRGTLWGHVELKNVHWNHPDFTFTASEVSFNPNIITLFNNRVYVNDITLSEATLMISNLKAPSPIKPIDINSHATAIVVEPLLGRSRLKLSKPGHVEISISNHVFKWVGDLEKDSILHWTFSSNAWEPLSIDAHGMLNVAYPNNVEGDIKALKFNFDPLSLRKHLIFSNISIKKIDLEQFLKAHSLSGSLYANIHQLNVISAFFPAIARPAGEIIAELQLKGYIQNPDLIVEVTLNNGKFYLPKDRIKINNIHAVLTGNLLETLQLNGFGNAGENSFTFKGSASPFLTDTANQLTLTGKNLQLHDTANMFIVASPDITLHYQDHAFYLQGIVEIPKGAIIQRNHQNIIRSQDVVFTGSTTDKANPIGFYPNIQLIIDEGFRYIDNKLDITLKGKLQVEKREDGLYSANGRLTIVEGEYQLESGTQYIRKGRLLFVPGTLLNDPLLDIKMASKSALQQKVSTENNIYVYGTLKKPIVQLFETNQKTFETLAKIGMSAHPSPTLNQKTLETRVLATGAQPVIGKLPFIETLQKNLGLEYGFETTNLDSPLSRSTTVFVISKPLSENFSIQILKGIREKNISSARLKYSLNENFDAILESGTEDNIGADLQFSKECD